MLLQKHNVLFIKTKTFNIFPTIIWILSLDYALVDYLILDITIWF